MNLRRFLEATGRGSCATILSFARKPMSAIVIIPTYRERENLPDLLELIWKSAPDLDVLIVDDHSGDGAPGYLKSRPEYGQRLHLLERRNKDGLARAYLAGFDWALAQPYE